MSLKNFIILLFILINVSEVYSQNNTGFGNNRIFGKVRITNYNTPPDTITAKNGIVKVIRVTGPGIPMLTVIDSSKIDTNGNYNIENLPDGLYFIVGYPNDIIDTDNPNQIVNSFVLTFFPNTQNYLSAEKVFVSNGMIRNCMITSKRMTYIPNQFQVDGYVYDSTITNLRLNNAVIFARLGVEFKGFAITDQQGNYIINSLPSGTYNLMATRFGYRNQTKIVNVGGDNGVFTFYLGRDSANFININNISEVIENFELKQNYPNPFNPETNISFYLPEKLTVSLKIYNVLGKEVYNLINGVLESGYHTFKYSPDKELASGLYFYRISLIDDGVEFYSTSKSMILLK